MPGLAALSPEARLACTALRVELGHVDADALRDQLTSDLDPERVVRFCVYHGIAPSVRRALGTGPDTSMAATLRDALAAPVQACAGAGLHKAQVLADILDRFADAGIAVMPLKGTGLDVRFYDGPGRRKDGDHDLLVRPEQLPDAVRVLSEMGFQSSKEDLPPPAQWPNHIDKHHAPPLIRPSESGPRVPVELHWNVSPDEVRFPLHNPDALTKALWTRSEPDTLLGAPVRRLAPTDEVLVLLLHTVRHFTYRIVDVYLRLAMLEDLARVTAQLPDLDPDCLRARANRVGPIYLLAPLHYLWQHVLGTVPSWLDDASTAAWPPAWGRPLLSVPHLLSDATRTKDHTRIHAHKLHAAFVSLLLLQRPADRAALLRRMSGTLFTLRDRDREALPFDLPPGMRGLYHPVRLVRLLSRLLRQ